MEIGLGGSPVPEGMTRPGARPNLGEKPWESELAGTLPAADRCVKAKVGGRGSEARAGTGDDPDPAPDSDGQGIREREIILHRVIGMWCPGPGASSRTCRGVLPAPCL